MSQDIPSVSAARPPLPTGSPLSGDSSPRLSWKQYALDFVKAPGRAKAALIGSLLLVALSPAGLAAMSPFIVPAYAMSTGTSAPNTILLFVSIPLVFGPLFLPFIGRAVDRYGARRVALPSVILYAILTATVPLAGGMTWLLGVVLALAAVCGFSASLGIVYKVISGWFPEHRGIGFGLIGVMSGVFAAVTSPIFQWLVNGNAPAASDPSKGAAQPGTPAVDPGVFAGFGWDGTYLIVAGAIAVIGIPTVLWLISEPKLAIPSGAPKIVEAALPGVPFRKAIWTRPWFLILAFLVLAAAGPIAMRQSAVDVFGQSGIDPATVSVALSVLFSTSIVGLLGGGTALDRARRPWVVALLLLGAPVGLLLALVSNGSVALLFVSMALLGIVAGVESALGPTLVARYFGLKSFAALQGLILAISGVALALAPYLFSALEEVTGSYGPPLIMLIVLGVVSVVCAALLPKFPEPWVLPVPPAEDASIPPRSDD